MSVPVPVYPSASEARPPVLVIGCGVNGLSCAIRLRERGFPVTIVTERRTPDTTSDRAAAIFSPHRLCDDERIRRWSRTSFDAFRRLADEPDSGVSLGGFREFFFEPLEKDAWWREIVPKYERLSELPAGYRDGHHAIVPRMDMTRYMPYLERRFVHDLGGRIETGVVASFSGLIERGWRIVVNCAGLGAGPLANDDRVFPIRGQIMHVPNDLGLTEPLLEERRGEALTYVFPFQRHVVLGGTYEKDRREEATDDASLQAILHRCRTLLCACGDARWPRLGINVTRKLAGLRPGRRSAEGQDADVRLETERIGDLAVVHNYGHGGVGVTLSWGCAEEVIQQVHAEIIN